MNRPATHFAALGLLALALGLLPACSGGAPPWQEDDIYDVSGDYKIGQPYEISGVWYHPRHEPDYDETGIASWYGPGFHGRTTANGEIFDQEALTAAHTTLPMPVLVRVTNLENGRSLLLRVNDRGPFIDGRIIDVSRHAAEQLGFREQGLAWVRVQYVAGGPGNGGATRLASAAVNDAADAPVPQPRSDPSPAAPETAPAPLAGGQLFVQMQALADYPQAAALRDRLRRFGGARIDELVIDGVRHYRLRIGPWADERTAYDMLQEIVARGYAQAQLVAVSERIIGGAELLLSGQ